MAAVKIGYASNVASRLHTLRMGNPFDLELLASALIPSVRDVEEGFHEMFASARIRGEWFRWSSELGALIDSAARYEARRRHAAIMGKEPPRVPPELSASQNWKSMETITRAVLRSSRRRTPV